MIQTGDAVEWPSTPMQTRHNQQLASQPKFYNADESQGYDIAGCIHLDREKDLPAVASNNDAIASQNQYWHHGRITDPETSEARLEPVPPHQAPGSTVSQTETKQDQFAQDSHELEAFLRDQICTCTSCLNDCEWPRDLLNRLDAHPKGNSWLFRCRITGCQWTTKDDTQSDGNNLRKLLLHETGWWSGRKYHYGKYGDYRCRETGCKLVTKRWTDFKRHSSSKHCIKPKNFECPFLSCKYHQLGFSRKDKLKSHFDKVHKRDSQPGKPNQAIKPKGEDSA